MSNLPILDISNLRLNPSSTAAHETAIQLRDICHNQGFCYIIGHGMSARYLKIAAAMQAFFNLPLSERKKLNLMNSPHFRGYTILGNELTGGKRDWRDQLDFGDELPAPILKDGDPVWHNLRGPNQWPKTLPSFRPAVESWMGGMYEIGTLLTQALAEGMGLGANYFDPYFTPKGDARLKLIRYRVPEKGGSSQGVGWHHDTGFLTFIMQDEIGGLQVDIDGKIIDATPIASAGEDALVMNMGEMLQVATGGYLRATPHRVISPPPGARRHSIAYFFNPKLEAKFAPIPLPPELAGAAHGAQNTNLNDPVFNVVGANILKTRLRAHPDVAAKYYT
jgi:isopenicillin N synthase-like dioxygenase